MASLLRAEPGGPLCPAARGYLKRQREHSKAGGGPRIAQRRLQCVRKVQNTRKTRRTQQLASSVGQQARHSPRRACHGHQKVAFFQHGQEAPAVLDKSILAAALTSALRQVPKSTN